MKNNEDPTTTSDGRLPTEFPPYTGNHLWVMSANYRVNPLAVQLGDEEAILDRETLVLVAGPLCLHCASTWPPNPYECTGQATL